MSHFVTFGEIMGRLAPPGMLRLQQTLPGSLDMMFAGAEANVAVSLAILGADVSYVTALPINPLGDACVASLRALGIDTSRIVRSDQGRLGLFFVETGANQRPSRVIYDRSASTISVTPAEDYDWPSILNGARGLHVTGITPAVSRTAAEATIQCVQQAKEAGVTVSCDLNFRAKLWRWSEETDPKTLAGQVMRKVLPSVDLLIANEEDCGDVLGIHAAHSDVQAGRIEVEAYPDVARQVVEQFPNVRMVATTLRESYSASHNNWGAMLYDAQEDRAYFAPEEDGEYEPYEIRNIVDRVGGGDSFAAGLLFALDCDDFAGPGEAVGFAAAASCLAHSVAGDFNYVSRAEVEALMGGSTTGRVVR